MGLRSPIPRFAAAFFGMLAVALAAASAAQAAVYWTTYDSDKIGRANLDGTGANQSFMNAAAGGGYAPGVLGVAVDRAHIYWTNNTTNTMGRANLDGTYKNSSKTGESAPTGVNPNFISGLGYTLSVAVDGAHIYWTNDYNATIGRANLDGTGVNRSIMTVLAGGGYQHLFGVAVDRAHIYWAIRNTNTIGRSNLDGTGINPNFIPTFMTAGVFGVSHPTSVAVDGAHIYWTNWVNPDNPPNARLTIARARLDGTGVQPDFIKEVGYPEGVAVDGAHIYWTHNNPPGIGRANLDGTGVNRSFITTDLQPARVAVDPAAVRALNASPTAFRAAVAGPSAVAATNKRPTTGAVVTFSLNEPASVSFRVQRPATGRRGKNGTNITCDPPNRRNRNSRECTRFVTLKGSFTRAGLAGANKFRFTGRVDGKQLAPGSYRLVATPTVSAVIGPATSISFRIIR